jgi:hypothetical protein
MKRKPLNNHFKQFMLIALLFLSFASCKKDNSSSLPVKDKIANAKLYYLKQIQKTTNYLKSNHGNSIKISLHPLWDQVETIELGDNTLAITLPVQTDLYKRTKKDGSLYLVMSDKAGIIQFKFINRFNDNTILDNTKLTPSKLYHLAFADTRTIGDSNVQDRLRNKPSLTNGVDLKSNIKSLTNLKDKITMASGCTHYYWVETYWENGVPIDQTVDYMYSDCSTDQSPDLGEGGGGPGGENTDMNIMPPPPETPIVDIKKFLDCFDKSKPASLTVYAEKIGSSFPGHAFISIKQGENNMVFGFYPKEKFPNNISGTGIMGDNSEHAYNAATNYGDISAEKLQKIIDISIKFSSSNYTLANNNCANFALEVLRIIGVTDMTGVCTPDNIYDIIKPFATGTNSKATKTQRTCN